MIKWKEVTWYSKAGALVSFLVVIPSLAFYFGGEFRSLSSATTARESVVAPRPSVPQAAGYYRESGRSTPDSPYIKIVQSGEVLHITGYAEYQGSGDVNSGDLSATTTIDAHGVAYINLTDKRYGNGNTCYLYLIFGNQNSPSSSSPKTTDTIFAHQTDGGFSCGFGNNVQFSGEYDRSSNEPKELPNGAP